MPDARIYVNRWERHPIITAQDILNRIISQTGRFTNADDTHRVFLALSQTEAAAITAPFPYVALVHDEDEVEFNDFAADVVRRIDSYWDVLTFVERSVMGQRRDGANEALRVGLEAAKDATCALQNWFPNQRYRPVQKVNERWANYFGSDRVARIAKIRLSYLDGMADDKCTPPPLVCVDEVDAQMVDGANQTKPVVQHPKDFTIQG